MEFALIIHLLAADMNKEKEVLAFPDFATCQIARDNLREVVGPGNRVDCQKREITDMAFTGRYYTR